MQMLAVLEHPIGVPQGRTEVRFIGKPNDALIRRCLGRMVNWVIVAESTLRAEFPSFETIQALVSCYILSIKLNYGLNDTGSEEYEAFIGNLKARLSR